MSVALASAGCPESAYAVFALGELFRSPYGVTLLGDREASIGKRIADQPVRIEVDLKIMFVVAVMAHSLHRPQRSSWIVRFREASRGEAPAIVWLRVVSADTSQAAKWVRM